MSKVKNFIESTIALICVIAILALGAYGCYAIGSLILGTGATIIKKAAGPDALQIRPDAIEKVTAYEAAVKLVKNNLVAPATAKFAPYTYNAVKTVDYCTWIVTSHVDSQNSFGAMLRTNHKIKIMLVERPYQKPYWKMLSLTTW